MSSLFLLGFGAIGQDLVALLGPELDRRELHILGAAVRDPGARREAPASFPLIPVTEARDAYADADLIVECAGVGAAIEHGPAVVRAGRDLLLTSVGALVDEDARLGMLSGPGSLTVTNGAIGGLDILAAAAQADGLDAVSIQTSKLASSLVRPWMSDAERAGILALEPGDDPIVAFDGDPKLAIAKFPANINVAVALAWATQELLPQTATPKERSVAFARSLARVRVRILADPDATLSRHIIRATGASGDYEFVLQNAPSPTNPRTSGVTAMSLARDVRRHFSSPR
ncbi:aspartate dehydrogenase domain-containing protein [Gulosibacter molinativorax]|uniref:DUF108 domain-containing protein n=1 Tax=Gulosibacter molinativorax TaxID=256821 RepID=A0ABT7CBV9_9MICO|nr:aspartate dehydrogenase domain-containing protein [Gulosibacter molinativorax]MDJ1372237.1 DUF108 domain-containing protein [Gulosibacter molinativorax]QUY63480.1 L-aspartate dehydrogenase [Gulosibacter molinativorax]